MSVPEKSSSKIVDGRRGLFSKTAYRSLPQGHGLRQELAQRYRIVAGLADIFLRGLDHFLGRGAAAVVHVLR